MKIAKRLLRPLFSRLGYDIRKASHIGLDAVNDIKTIYGQEGPRVIFDVGAHRGETATLFARSFPQAQIHSFEPASDTFAALQRAVSPFPNVRAVNAALGRTDGLTALNVNKFSPANSLLKSAAPTNEVGAELMDTIQTQSVNLRALDSYCQEARVGFIDLLKMDVQGFELEVLRGAEMLLKSQNVALIYSEVLFKRLYEGQPFFEDLSRELAGHGFELVDLYGHVRSAHHTLRWCDALFVHPRALEAARARPASLSHN
jgi:FkbM family methyltransferase